MKHLVMVAILFCWLGAAAADIIEWQGADGVRHYTNLKGEVPKEEEGSTRVVVDELVRQPAGAADPAGVSAPQAPEPRREAEVIYDRSQEVSDAYVRGLQRGLDAAGIVAGGGGGGVQINGPLAIAKATSPTPYDDGYYYPGYYPFVTTSFDRGRSRHMTLRMLLQDQFALDRAGPFVFDERLFPPFGHLPLGVDLNPFLPRGLPHGFPRETRVIRR
jgi:hypothetical protein